MLQGHPPFPLKFRTINQIGQFLRRLGVPLLEFKEEVVLEAATKITGLTDFGDEHLFKEGFSVVLESANKEANVHFIGRIGLHKLIVNSLRNRLLLIEAQKKEPTITQQALIPPIIVLGIPRSGTTFLHRLLACDPSGRPLPLWEIGCPIPPPGPDIRWQEVDERTQQMAKLAPGLDKKHFMRADTPEECLVLFISSFNSIAFWALYPMYSYAEWYKQSKRLENYQEYRFYLQYLQRVHPNYRLVLKSPMHFGSLAELLQTVPEALIIQTHRNPINCCNSFNSLIYTIQEMTTDNLDVKKMVQLNFKGVYFMKNLTKDLKGQVAVVTGGGSGIGQGVALALANTGVKVALCGRRLAPLEKTVAEMKDMTGEGLVIQADVSKTDDAHKVIKRATEAFGPISILINNAGIGGGGFIHNHTIAAWDEVMAVNLRGPFLMMRLALPMMREAKQGHIINISSESAMEHYKGNGAYGVSKHALNALGEYAQRENQDYNIRVDTVCPGMVVTEMTDKHPKLNHDKCMYPEDIADLVMWLLTRRDNIKIGRPILIQTMENPWQ